jgi:KDO2-lipid IV(A) lauroyltransferase
MAAGDRVTEQADFPAADGAAGKGSPAEGARRRARPIAAGRIADLGYAAGWAIVRWVPEPVARACFRRIADLLWRRRGRGVARLEANLGRVLGPDASPERLQELSRRAMRSYLRYWCEVFRLPRWSPADVERRTTVDSQPILFDALAAGRGVVAVLPHMGNWDQAGAWIVGRGVSLTTVVERLRPESLFDRFVAYRKSLGMEVLPLTGGASTFSTLAARLRAGGLVCLLGDRDLTSSGIEVNFFDEPARMPGGPAALALATGAALMPVTLWYEDAGLRIRLHPLIEPPAGADRRSRVAAATQQVAAVFQEGIANHPEDWHMLQRVWVADRPAGRGSAPEKWNKPCA